MTGEVFVGRTDELKRFAALLGELPPSHRRPNWVRSRKSRKDPAGAARSRVVLVYGLGGIIAPFIGIKLIDMIIASIHLV